MIVLLWYVELWQQADVIFFQNIKNVHTVWTLNDVLENPYPFIILVNVYPILGNKMV